MCNGLNVLFHPSVRLRWVNGGGQAVGGEQHGLAQRRLRLGNVILIFNGTASRDFSRLFFPVRHI
jgi:hypothetical protein